MTDYALRCEISAAREGQPHWHFAGDPDAGRACVEHDGKRWTYRIERGEIRAFRAWLAEAFSGFGTQATVAGRFPHYEIKTRS